MDYKLFEELKSIYLEGFSDSESYASYFISNAVQDNILTYRINEELVSAGYIFYKEAKLFGRNIKLPYLSALSTKKEMRGRGLINHIILPAFEKLYSRGDTFAVLNPFNPDYYKKFDFCDISYCDKRIVSGGRKFDFKTAGPEAIVELEEVEASHAAGFDNYLIKRQEDIGKIIEEYARDGVAGFVYFDSGKPFAYAFCSDTRVEYYATTDEARFDLIDDLIGKQYDRFSGRSAMFLQGRIINVRKALLEYDYLPGTNASLNIAVKDRILAQNNITINLTITNGIAAIKNTEYADIELSAQDLCSFMFNGGLEIFIRQKCLFKDKY